MTSDMIGIGEEQWIACLCLFKLIVIALQGLQYDCFLSRFLLSKEKSDIGL